MEKIKNKFKVAVEEIVINYYVLEAEDEQCAMDNYMEGEHVSTKPKSEDILWAEEIV